MDGKKEELERISPAQMIVDLYEIRALYLQHHKVNGFSKYEGIRFDFQYHVLSNAISAIEDKYKVKYYDIDEEIEKRAFIEKQNNQFIG